MDGNWTIQAYANIIELLRYFDFVLIVENNVKK